MSPAATTRRCDPAVPVTITREIVAPETLNALSKREFAATSTRPAA